MFKVYKSIDNVLQEFDVFDIRYDSTGYPHFLLYINDEWQVISAKEFTPMPPQSKSKGRKKKTLVESSQLDYNFTVRV